MGDNLEKLPREALIDDVKRLRAGGIRAHRDAQGRDLCWYHPGLWSFLPEKTDPVPRVP